MGRLAGHGLVWYHFALLEPLPFTFIIMSHSNPCVQCGACCAYFRVSFYWGQTNTHPEGTVPIELTEPISPHYVAMRGTNQAQKRCIALAGDIGQTVGCTIYAQRSETCRGFEAGDERCNLARRHWGLTALGFDGIVNGLSR